MATEIVADHPDAPLPGITDALTLADDRVQVGLEAAWEVDALCGLARDLAEDVARTLEQTELMRLSLQLRGVVLRIERLNSALMALLSDDDNTQNLQKKVLGIASGLEVAHG